MHIAVLGSGCTNCHALEHATRKALDELGLHEDVALITDIAEIASYGVMATPALVIDGEIRSSGRVPTVSELEEILAAAAV